jgi:hypothetical protein
MFDWPEGWHSRGGVSLFITSDKSYICSNSEANNAIVKILNINKDNKYDSLRAADLEAKLVYNDASYSEFDKSKFRWFVKYLRKNGYIADRSYASEFGVKNVHDLEALSMVLTCISNNQKDLTSRYQRDEVDEDNVYLHCFRKKRGMSKLFSSTGDRGDLCQTISMNKIVSFIANYSGVSFMLYSGKVHHIGRPVADESDYDELFDSLMNSRRTFRLRGPYY